MKGQAKRMNMKDTEETNLIKLETKNVFCPRSQVSNYILKLHYTLHSLIYNCATTTNRKTLTFPTTCPAQCQELNKFSSISVYQYQYQYPPFMIIFWIFYVQPYLVFFFLFQSN